jgi:hypothetical protein
MIVFAMIGARTPAFSQEIEPPFTWEGKGVASLIAEYGINEIGFTMQLEIGENGEVSGKTASEDGESKIVHVFYGQQVRYDLPDYFTRKAIIVLLINEDGDEPMIVILDGRLLAGRFFVGEVLLAEYEKDSATARALGFGDPMATEIYEGYLSSSLKAALKKGVPLGTFKIEGAYK